jgi:hypothetical protein
MAFYRQHKPEYTGEHLAQYGRQPLGFCNPRARLAK